ncbi:PVC-type heme-binding CxxCH protein [Mucilaginibacter myungsuensis]|uniref:ThuA domain-containing protein n=1 Tax=Mucilaginibacter myungsuensis TaxID=649104 RepID=A0A929KXB1_9SPHI|nr:PVC-type heme-binding CxxCH protein [Mucilaginibacter myungsuensis]MBE9662892.1 ThuA domain-containing protein [Mucilaginibacter myungsuensis]MDN3598512.1 ThuA domain-containing protein [Mucilaginibacter myungsuensis]
MKKYVAIAAVCLVAIISFNGIYKKAEGPHRLEILLLGHNSEHHNSEKFAEIVQQAFFKDGINISYTTDPNDLNDANLAHYDGLMIYANHDTITPSQEKALINYVKSGKGFIPVHCASWCFRNSEEYIKMVGGQFSTHKTDTFTTVIVDKKHQIMKGITPFNTWDETYVHSKINKDIHVLTERVEGDHHEPYTWTNQYGKGRVFYTAYGHDQRTWKNPEFLKLLENGLVWAVGKKAAKDLAKLSKPTPAYTDADIPNYENRNPKPKLQAALSPAESQLLTQIPVGFKMQLFAAEPDIEKPIAMAWDEKGRLWILETIDYPNTVREDKGQGLDRIKICEDTNGDGKADKFTIFADKLNIPTSIVFARGGVIVSQAPDMIFLKDSDGDDKADVREKIVSGFGTFDTHAGPSNLKYGFDNKIWATVGYSGFKGTVGGQRFDFNQAAFRFTADGKWMEHLGTTSNNTWGLGLSEKNDVFISTANNSHSDYLGIPFSYLNRVGMPGWESVKKIEGHYGMHVVTKNLRQVDVFNGFTAAAGHNLYTARNFPQEYWNKIAFVNEPTGRVIHRAVLEPDGAGFKEKDGWNFLASADEWLAPVQSEVGPDGAVWLADWYNFIIQHNPTPRGFENGKGNAYINPLRDRTHGRIYRIVYDGAKPSAITKLDKNNPEELLAALKNDNMFWRMTAQRLIVEGGYKQLAAQLYAMIQNKDLDDIGNNPAALHALWTLHGLGLINANNAEGMRAAEQALNHTAPAVRKAAIQVLPLTASSANSIVSAGLLNDINLNTRLAAVLAIADMPASDAIGERLLAAQKVPQNMNDYWLTRAFKIAITTHVKGALEKLRAATAEAASKADLARTRPDQIVKINVVQNAMKYDIKEFTVKAGSMIEVEFKNPDFMQHNLLILQRGSLEKVGLAADKLAQDPKGLEQNYIPKMPEVLFATKLINPQETIKLKFRAPADAGDYPFICSFPGHWRIMSGVMKVTK